jgi:hypothetical protein
MEPGGGGEDAVEVEQNGVELVTRYMLLHKGPSRNVDLMLPIAARRLASEASTSREMSEVR